MNQYKTIYSPCEGEIEEKKSRFICHIIPIDSEEEALAFIEKMKKQYWDARHNCYAYILEGPVDYVRASDDGEPQKTAGQPILSVLQGADLKNVCAVVTRYFGGTLLGTGGLVRAYTDATAAALKAGEIIEKIPGRLLSITTDYNGLGKLQYLMGSLGLPIMNTEYAENVKVEICLPLSKVNEVTKKLIDSTNGRAVIEEGDEVIFAEIDGVIEIQ